MQAGGGGAWRVLAQARPGSLTLHVAATLKRSGRGVRYEKQRSSTASSKSQRRFMVGGGERRAAVRSGGAIHQCCGVAS